MDPGSTTARDNLLRVRAGRGRWPADVLAPLAERPTVVGVAPAAPGEQWEPELSLHRGEWYFTEATRQDIAAYLEGDVLLAGTPSLLDVTANALLVDDSPWLLDRFEPRAGSHLDAPFERYESTRRFQSTVLDPPWYFPIMLDWIRKASSLTEEGGYVHFPLLGEGTRPSAAADRARVLEACAEIGRTYVLNGAVLYETPLFEHEASLAAGVELREAWRVADLVRLRVEQHPTLIQLSDRISEWTEVRIGSQILAIRGSRQPPVTKRAATLLAPVPGVAGWVLDTVSRRDDRWRQVNVWTSRNRVAATANPGRLLRAAVALAGTKSWLSTTPEDDTLQQLRDWLKY